MRKYLASSASTPEEWSARGEEFFGNKDYENARQCFHRGGNKVRERFCTGTILANAAELELFKSSGGGFLGGASLAKAVSKFLEAAEIFEAPPLEMFEKAAEFSRKG